MKPKKLIPPQSTLPRIFVIICPLSGVSQMTNGKYKRKKQHAKRDEQQRQSQPIVLDGAGDSETQTKVGQAAKENTDQQEERSMRFSEFIKSRSLTDWLLVAFTGIVSFVAYYQLQVANHQLDEMQIDQRPWLKITSVEKIETPINQNILAPITLTNIGKTPAKKVKGWIVFRVYPKKTAIDFRDPATISGDEIQFSTSELPSCSPTTPPHLQRSAVDKRRRLDRGRMKFGLSRCRISLIMLKRTWRSTADLLTKMLLAEITGHNFVRSIPRDQSRISLLRSRRNV
jgi:hypothetical protein